MNLIDALVALFSNQYVRVLVVSLAAFIVIIVLNKYLRKGLSTTKLPADAQVFVRKTLVYLLIFCVLMYIIQALNLGAIFYPVMGASVLVGAALALAVKDILADAVSGFFLLTDKHFNIGDEITTQGHRGEIIDVTLRKTRLKTADGTIIVLANGKIDASGWVLHHPDARTATEQT
ncbi:MAG TPA: mechanosensitive ion channel [Methanomicrobia archaeon]|nr:mechanosensitive ion channel [Methanomicrobia archaeon]